MTDVSRNVLDQPPNPSRSTRRRFLLGALGASLALCIALIAAGIAFGLGATSRWPEATEPTGLDQVEVPLHGAEAAKRRLDDGFLRGMTVSCPGYGRIWGSRSMQSSLTELASLGVRWVSIHPYAGVRRNGTIRFEPAAETGYLERSVAYAREAGIELFWKPHLAYWGSFEWRGTIEFGEDEAAWRRFFDGYRAFIIDHARFAERHGIPLLSIGLEYERTTGREAEWRRIIADVRRVYSGQITYAANWDRLGAVPFWDALDLIGVQAYFPLSGSADPSIGEIQASWDAHLSRLRELSERYEKPVLFAEIGYDVSPLAASEPWLTKSRDNPTNRALQQRLMEVALSRIEREPHIRGMFWWKWMPGSRNYGDFAMRHPRVMETLRRAWAPS